jgi:ADP-ribose pyrophosphatase YjhB (NUDIX family)
VRLKLIACEALYREACAAVARSPHQVDIQFVPKGLHNQGGPAMRDRLQQLVDRVDAECCDAILLGYGLCGNGVAGLSGRALPLVVPRAHDCIALLMGGRERYRGYFEDNPGVYFRSTGWLERGEDLAQATQQVVRDKTGVGYTLDDLIAKYGEENGRYLFEQFNGYQRNYRQLTFIATGLEPDRRFEEQARAEAERRGWQFASVPGDLRLFEQLVSGEWPESDFLVVPPGWRIKPTYDGGVMDKEPAP